MGISVAIDGPAAAGKSTIAKKVAEIKGYTYIDTGAMYRAYTWHCLDRGLDCTDEQACVAEIPNISIELKPGGTVLCNGKDITREIRMPIINKNVTPVCQMKPVRLFLVDQQRKMAEKDNVIMDGRDIGTYVLPDAEVKIFQVASPECRAQRRYKENMEKGIPCTYEEILEDVNRRDKADSERAFAPLKPAPDSVHLDTSDMSIDEVVNKVLEIIDSKVK
ncbi:MAG: (d)CMP kinase [Erysipelotrichaceae bacterium]|nr:(d)CMP kinase [Erysipelotrichaceae bacterium]